MTVIFDSTMGYCETALENGVSEILSLSACSSQEASYGMERKYRLQNFSSKFLGSRPICSWVSTGEKWNRSSPREATENEELVCARLESDNYVDDDAEDGKIAAARVR